MCIFLSSVSDHSAFLHCPLSQVQSLRLGGLEACYHQLLGRSRKVGRVSVQADFLVCHVRWDFWDFLKELRCSVTKLDLE